MDWLEVYQSMQMLSVSFKTLVRNSMTLYMMGISHWMYETTTRAVLRHSNQILMASKILTAGSTLNGCKPMQLIKDINSLKTKTNMADILKLLLLVSILTGCKSSQKCDAYGYIKLNQYDYIQVVGYTDTVPTFGETWMQLPKGEYQVKAWKDKQEYVLNVKL
jgi:hypothetical protein